MDPDLHCYLVVTHRDLRYTHTHTHTHTHICIRAHTRVTTGATSSTKINVALGISLIVLAIVFPTAIGIPLGLAIYTHCSNRKKKISSLATTMPIAITSSLDSDEVPLLPQGNSGPSLNPNPNPEPNSNPNPNPNPHYHQG